MTRPGRVKMQNSKSIVSMLQRLLYGFHLRLPFE